MMNLPKIPILSVLIVFILSSCTKNENKPEIIIEPPMPIEVKLDSIITGSLYNVTIGSIAEEVYMGLQEYSNGKINNLSVVGNVHSKVVELKDRISLYNSLILDQKPSSPLGGQLSFKDNKVQSIYLRDGSKVNSWPTTAQDPIRVGDAVESIYNKLLKLENDTKHARLLEYMGMFEKNMRKSFDPNQEKSNHWYFSILEDEKNMFRVDLDFQDGKLIKIRRALEVYL